MLSFVVSTIAFLFVMVCLLMRANDLRWKPGYVWKARVIGLTLGGFASMGIIAYEAVTHDWPSPYEVWFRVGIALTLITTPNSIPFWKYLTRGEHQ